jgi:hypothetical protein
MDSGCQVYVESPLEEKIKDLTLSPDYAMGIILFP